MNTETAHICNYAVLRFSPYPETGEFVNVGVVVECATAGLLTSRVETSRQRRVTDFFPDLDPVRFRNARAAIVAEIQRVEQLLAAPKRVNRGDSTLGRELFLELVKPRESIFRFGEICTILTANPRSVVSELFERYVDRQFAERREYREAEMARRYLEALRSMRPGQTFDRNREVGSADYRVRVPILSRALDGLSVPRRVLKPLNLCRESPSSVIDHGDAWIGRVRRLKGVNRLPERFVFAVCTPTTGILKKAADDIIEKLLFEGVAVGDADDTERIVALTAD